MAEHPEAVGDTATALAQNSQKGSALQTVDLGSQTSSQQKPSLQFDSASNEIDDGEAAEVPSVSPIHGTQLQSRPRTSSKGAAIKEWGSHQFKITKQVVSERFGRGTRTVDPQLESRVDMLKETQRKYAQLIALVTQFHTHFKHVVETQKSLAEHFAFMSVRTPELHTEFHYNAESQKRISRNGETLLAAVNFFVSNMQTLCHKTIDDTLQTVKDYDATRLSYDAYRTDLEVLKKQVNTVQVSESKLAAASEKFEKHKKKFEQLRSDVDIKLKLLGENKVCVNLALSGAVLAHICVPFM